MGWEKLGKAEAAGMKKCKGFIWIIKKRLSLSLGGGVGMLKGGMTSEILQNKMQSRSLTGLRNQVRAKLFPKKGMEMMLEIILRNRQKRKDVGNANLVGFPKMVVVLESPDRNKNKGARLG
ncbi:hypothetical protein AgCh_017117 [Apium graveolens]